jgi:hypothetical protein
LNYFTPQLDEHSNIGLLGLSHTVFRLERAGEVVIKNHEPIYRLRKLEA